MRISFVLEISHMWQRNKPGIYRSTVTAKLRSKRIPPMEGWLNPLYTREDKAITKSGSWVPRWIINMIYCLISESALRNSFMGCSLNYFIWNNNVLFGKPMLFYVIQPRMKWVKKVTQILMRMTHNFKCWIQFLKPFKGLL